METNSSKVSWEESQAKFYGKKTLAKILWKETQRKISGKRL